MAVIVDWSAYECKTYWYYDGASDEWSFTYKAEWKYETSDRTDEYCVENKSEQVTKKDDVENKGHKFDAKEKSSNEYERSGSGAYSKRSFKEGNVTVKQDEDVFFDIKV